MVKTKKLPVFRKPPLDNLIITNSQRAISISLSSVKKIVQFLLKEAKKAEMALHFVGEKKIASLHKAYFDDPSVTDCITFPYHDPTFLGEVFICPQVANHYVKKHGGNLYDEITLYIVHGFLHLLGYEDKTVEGTKKIRTAEKKWLRVLAKNHLRVTP